MTDEDTSHDATSIDRRTLIKASSASLAGGLFTGQAAADPGEGRSADADDEDREPDVRVVDNSESPAAVVVKTRYVGDDPAKGAGQRVEVHTAGSNSPHVDSEEAAQPSGRARGTIDRLEEPQQGLYEVEVRHKGHSDTTVFGIGPQGGAVEETVEVQVMPDGTVKADTGVVCGV